MAVKLRLRRMGKKRQPIYKLVAADVRSPRDGRFIEAIGIYNPKTNPSTVEIDEERALYWLGVGAQPTDTVKNLLSAEGILYKQSLLRKGMTEEEVSTAMQEWNKNKESKEATAKAKVEKAKSEKEKAKAKEEAKKAEAAEAEAKKAEEAEAKKAEEAEAETKPEAAPEAEEKPDAAEETKEEKSK